MLMGKETGASQDTSNTWHKGPTADRLYSHMATSSERAAFDRGVRPLMQMLLTEKAEAVISFHADPGLQQRIDDLAGKPSEGLLTESERSEYTGYVRANTFVAILQQHPQRLIES